ncbi:MAG: M48 family metallopeptidase [Gammaproteobacteria bacterium]|nr:M48 family metallopeptidase [Gammaproteobacteria bacterium]
MNFFKSQDVARKNTLLLVTLFSLAIISLVILTNILVMVVFGYIDSNTISTETFNDQFDWPTFLLVGAAVTSIIVFGSLYKIMSLSGGGARVAEMMDAELIVEDSGDINKQKILNVVEEMAIASGTPVPPVYLLDEDGINAFAAGYKASDAVIGITRGAIEKLSREQLQGVIAHEFSHVFNGDMRLNIRLIGILHGITIIGIIGYYLLRTTGRSSSRRSKNDGAAAILALGAGLFVIGYAGTFFGNVIKAAVSRQREFLADASAIQFTRNPDGIAGALKRIGGNASGSLMENAHTSEISHTLFSQGISTFLSGIFSTHPPLANRIQRIDPHWDGKFDFTREEKPDEKEYDSTDTTDTKNEDKTAAVLTALAASMNVNAITSHTGQASVEHLNYSHTLISSIPDILKNAAHEPCGARALIYFLVLDTETNLRQQQLQHLMAYADPGAYRETVKLSLNMNTVENEFRLPLVDMALSSLRQLSKKQYQLFKENLDILITMDKKISLSEWMIQKIVTHHLDRIFKQKQRRAKENLTLSKTKKSCCILLSLLSHSGKQQGIDKQRAFDLGNAELGNFDIELLDKNKLNLNDLNQALEELVRLKPLHKPKLLKACVACITADRITTITEAELFRAIADTLDCPMPPLVV